MKRLNKNIIKIGNKAIGSGQAVFIIAEISANHLQNFNRTKKLVRIACECGVDAVKLQTYTPDTLTLKSDSEPFQIKVNDAWKGRTLYELYEQTYLPWQWYPALNRLAKSYGKILFSTAYDDSAVEFLEKMKVPAYKIASFELPDLELLKKIAQTKKPVIISRGMATKNELRKAMAVLRKNGTKQIAVLHCVSSYPAKAEEMNLATIPDLRRKFKIISGLSDHSLVPSIAVAAVALGASIIEKHFTLKRSDGGFDAAFSLEPKELKELVNSVREVEKAIGKARYRLTRGEKENITFRRSLWVIKPIKQGEKLTRNNIGRYRPGHGLAIKYLSKVLGKKAAKDIEFATPLSWSLIK